MSTNILTVDKMKELTAISQAVDVNLLTPFINIAEEFYVKPVLTDDFYDSIVDDIEEGTLSGDTLSLVNTYVIPLCAYYSWYEGLPMLYIRVEAKGLVKKFSDNSNSIDSNDFKLLRQSILDKCVMLKTRLEKYLYENRSKFPLYANSCEPMGRTNSSGFFLKF
jgi:hypothetical protein